MPERRPDAGQVPVYQLYGEKSGWLTPEQVHCEPIAARSRLHNWEIQPHRHHGLFQCLWLSAGSAQCALDGRPSVLTGGEVLLVPQHCVHGFRFSPDAQGLVITFAYAFFEQLPGTLATPMSAMAQAQVGALGEGAERADIESTLVNLHRDYVEAAPHRDALLESRLITLLVLLVRRLPALAGIDTRSRARAYLDRFSQLIDADVARAYPLAHYADQLGISTAHLNALCRQLTQRSALQLVHARRALEARRQLVYTTLTVRDVAEALGFSDPAYFTRFFKRETGFSPSEFRLRAQQLAQTLGPSLSATSSSGVAQADRG